MGLRMKFNLVLLLAFVIGLGLAAYLSDRILKQNAREEVVQHGSGGAGQSGEVGRSARRDRAS